jgi:hypothetical protein
LSRLTSSANGSSQSNIADARAVAVADEVWVVTGSELVALEKEGLKETARIPVEGETCSDAVDEDRVFVVGTEPLLTRSTRRPTRSAGSSPMPTPNAATNTLPSVLSG